MRLISFLLAASLVGCAHGPLPAPARAGTRNVRLVDHVLLNPRADLWRASGWYRAFSDVTTPSRIVVSSDRSACLMPDNETVEPLPWHYYECASGWRLWVANTQRQ